MCVSSGNLFLEVRPEGVKLTFELVSIAGNLLSCEVGRPFVEVFRWLIRVDRVGDSVGLEGFVFHSYSYSHHSRHCEQIGMSGSVGAPQHSERAPIGKSFTIPS